MAQDLGHGIRRYRTRINNSLINEGRKSGHPSGKQQQQMPGPAKILQRDKRSYSEETQVAIAAPARKRSDISMEQDGQTAWSC
jgi:hypothetical protein